MTLHDWLYWNCNCWKISRTPIKNNNFANWNCINMPHDCFSNQLGYWKNNRPQRPATHSGPLWYIYIYVYMYINKRTLSSQCYSPKGLRGVLKRLCEKTDAVYIVFNWHDNPSNKNIKTIRLEPNISASLTHRCSWLAVTPTRSCSQNIGANPIGPLAIGPWIWYPLPNTLYIYIYIYEYMNKNIHI